MMDPARESFTLTDEEVDALLAFYQSDLFPSHAVWGDENTDFETNPPEHAALGALCSRLYHWYPEYGNW